VYFCPCAENSLCKLVGIDGRKIEGGHPKRRGRVTSQLSNIELEYLIVEM